MPGATWEPTSSRACAASRPATRIFSIVSASLTSLPVNGAGFGLSTYSGRAMWAGTWRRGEIVAAATGGIGTSVVSGVMSSFWYCVKHKTVEESGGDICPPIDRLGPFDTAEEASHALEKAEQRNQDW